MATIDGYTDIEDCGELRGVYAYGLLALLKGGQKMRATTIIGSVVLAGVLVGSLGAKVPASDCLPEYEKSSFRTPGFVFDESVVIKQYTYRSSHFYTHYIDDCHNFDGKDHRVGKRVSENGIDLIVWLKAHAKKTPLEVTIEAMPGDN